MGRRLQCIEEIWRRSKSSQRRREEEEDIILKGRYIIARYSLVLVSLQCGKSAYLVVRSIRDCTGQNCPVCIAISHYTSKRQFVPTSMVNLLKTGTSRDCNNTESTMIHHYLCKQGAIKCRKS